MTSLATVRHVSCSGKLFSFWEFDPARKILIMQIQLGSAKFELDEIPVCSTNSPRRLSWIVVRKSDDAWLLTTARWPEVPDASFAKGCSFHPDMPIGSLELIQAPSQVSAELESL